LSKPKDKTSSDSSGESGDERTKARRREKAHLLNYKLNLSPYLPKLKNQLFSRSFINPLLGKVTYRGIFEVIQNLEVVLKAAKESGSRSSSSFDDKVVFDIGHCTVNCVLTLLPRMTSTIYIVVCDKKKRPVKKEIPIQVLLHLLEMLLVILKFIQKVVITLYLTLPLKYHLNLVLRLIINLSQDLLLP